MFGDFALKYGINCIGDLQDTELRIRLKELLCHGSIDLLYPVIYRKPENGGWHMIVPRKDDYPPIPRNLCVFSKEEAVQRVERLFQPVFEVRCKGMDKCGVTARESVEIEDLREYYPEIDRWTDRAIKYAWSLYARIIHGSADYKMNSVLEKYPRDETFLDYLWHFKVVGDGQNFPVALKNKVGTFLANEVAVWRKWKRNGYIRTSGPLYD